MAFQPFGLTITAQLKPQATHIEQCTVHTVHCGIRYLCISNEEVSRDHASGLYGVTARRHAEKVKMIQHFWFKNRKHFILHQ